MPPNKKTADPEAPTTGPAPAHASELCSACGVVELDPASTTVFHCEHGTWNFTPDPNAAQPAAELSDEQKRAAALAILGVTEEQLAALTTPVS